MNRLAGNDTNGRSQPELLVENVQLKDRERELMRENFSLSIENDHLRRQLVEMKGDNESIRKKYYALLFENLQLKASTGRSQDAELVASASTSANVSIGSTNGVSSVSPSNLSSPTRTVPSSNGIKHGHLDLDNGQLQLQQQQPQQQPQQMEGMTLGCEVTVSTESNDLDGDVSEEMEEEEEEVEEVHNCDGCDRCLKKGEEVVDGNEQKVDNDELEGGQRFEDMDSDGHVMRLMQIDELNDDLELIRCGDYNQVDSEQYEVIQKVLDDGQLCSSPLRDTQCQNESIFEDYANLANQGPILNTADQPNDHQTVTAQSDDLFSPSTSTGQGSIRAATKRSQPQSNRSAKKSRQTVEDDEDIDEPVDGKIKVIHVNCTESNCRAKLSSIAHLYRHLRSLHGLNPLRCFAKDCNSRFNSSAQMAVHLKCHPTRTKFVCGLCRKEFASQKKCSGHRNHYHANGQFRCNLSQCVSVFDTRAKVNCHQRRHHCTESKRRQCGCCSVSFVSKGDLDRHESTHLDRRPFHCTWTGCDLRTIQRSTLLNHIRTVHFANVLDGRDPSQFVRVQDDE